MTRAAVYLRQSLDRTGDGAAVDRQRPGCLRVCADRGWEPVEYVDNDKSASSGKVRPAYVRMLADVSAGRIGAVVAWDLDRLHRRPVELEHFINLADLHRIELATVTGQHDLSTTSGRLTARIMGNVAKHEIEHKSERQRNANAQRAAKGLPPIGPRALGYEADGVTVRELEAAAVRAGFDAILAGGSLRTLAREWNAAGLTTSHGGEWRPDSVRYVMTNPRYAGLRASRTGRAWTVIGPGTWPALVGEETFRAVADLLSNPDRRTTPDTRRRYFLSGLALCGVCGAPCNTGGTQHGKRTLKCSVSRHLSRAAEPIEELVTEVIVARLSRPDAAELLVDSDRPDTGALRGDVMALRARLAQLAGLLADGVLTETSVREASARLRCEVAEIEAQMADAGRADVLGPLITAEDVATAWDGLDVDRRRAVVQTLMTVTLLSPGKGRRTFDAASVEVDWR
jgi:DNA invertase Pin-like site-specific DNA recombinase